MPDTPIQEYFNCASCGQKAIKNTYNQRFCSPKCRDNFFNKKKMDAIRKNYDYTWNKKGG